MVVELILAFSWFHLSGVCDIMLEIWLDANIINFHKFRNIRHNYKARACYARCHIMHSLVHSSLYACIVRNSQVTIVFHQSVKRVNDWKCMSVVQTIQCVDWYQQPLRFANFQRVCFSGLLDLFLAMVSSAIFVAFVNCRSLFLMMSRWL